MRFHAAPGGYPVCLRTAHSRRCPIPWGYDPDHTDQTFPYTLEQLAVRREVPHRYAYPSHREYLEGFRLWRALLRDSCPNRAEHRAAMMVKLDLSDLDPQTRETVVAQL